MHAGRIMILTRDGGMENSMGSKYVHMVFYGIFILAAVTLQSGAYAADTDIGKAVDGLSAPDSPAFAILNVSPQVISRPGSPRELAMSLLQGVDAQGHPQSGIAVETSPYLLFWGDDLTLEKYRDVKGRERALSRIQISLATAKGTGSEDQSLRIAAGVRTTLWDDGDPRLDQELTVCIDKAQQTALKAYPPASAMESDEERQARALQMETFVEARAKICRAESAKRTWNKSAMDIGIAAAWINRSSNSNAYNWDGSGAWMSVSHGFSKSQLILHARYRGDESVPGFTSGTGYPEQDSFTGGVRYRYGGPRQTLHAEGLYIQTKSSSATREESYRYLIGAELAVSENLWLTVDAGGSSGQTGAGKQKFITSQLKWALAEQKATK